MPFLDDEYMVGPPNFDEDAFLTPKQRRCPLDPTTLSWGERLGGGGDGYVWKVTFGDQGPFAIKVVSFPSRYPSFGRYSACL